MKGGFATNSSLGGCEQISTLSSERTSGSQPRLVAAAFGAGIKLGKGALSLGPLTSRHCCYHRSPSLLPSLTRLLTLVLTLVEVAILNYTPYPQLNYTILVLVLSASGTRVTYHLEGASVDH